MMIKNTPQIEWLMVKYYGPSISNQSDLVIPNWRPFTLGVFGVFGELGILI